MVLSRKNTESTSEAKKCSLRGKGKREKGVPRGTNPFCQKAECELRKGSEALGSKTQRG